FFCPPDGRLRCSLDSASGSGRSEVGPLSWLTPFCKLSGLYAAKKLSPRAPSLPGNARRPSSNVRLRRQNNAMGEDIEKLKQRLPLLDYLRQQNWTGRPAGDGAEFVGLCPLHTETHPSFYSTPAKISSTVTAAAR